MRFLPHLFLLSTLAGCAVDQSDPVPEHLPGPAGLLSGELELHPWPAPPPTQVPAAWNGDTGVLDTGAPATWFVDDDGDGYGDEPVEVLERPPGTVAVAGDCDDTDPLVHPGQQDFFLDPRPTGSYDYDCDGAEERRDLVFGACDADCSLEAVGWDAVTLPACGEGEAWLDACDVGDSCELVSDRTRIQACR